MSDLPPCPLSPAQRVTKRAFDVLAAGSLLVVASPALAVGWVLAALSTRAPGIYRQQRIGLGGEPFEVMKLRTMRVTAEPGTTVTTAGDVRITRTGAWLRRLKLDELPQLVNVLRGEMSLVGPRPDVSGYADQLCGPDRVLLTVRPGITGPASLAFRHEEQVLAQVADPEAYNRDVIWPEKVRLNREYVESWSFRTDVRCVVETFFSLPTAHEEAR